MNIRYTLIALLFANSMACAMAPGTVIEPINRVGQFTASQVAQDLRSPTFIGFPDIKAKTLAALKNRGIPAIASGATSLLPLNALAVGTGYLFLNNPNTINPSLIASLVGGMGYAMGEQAAQGISSLGKNHNLYRATQLALLLTCLIGTYINTNNAGYDAFLAATQAFAFYVLLELSTRTTIVQPTKTRAEKSTALIVKNKYDLIHMGKNALITGSDSFHAHAYWLLLELFKACDPDALAKILLYEQAYRLSQSGCATAKQLYSHAIKSNSK